MNATVACKSGFRFYTATGKQGCSIAGSVAPLLAFPSGARALLYSGERKTRKTAYAITVFLCSAFPSNMFQINLSFKAESHSVYKFI
jgi:hypothetical protein